MIFIQNFGKIQKANYWEGWEFEPVPGRSGAATLDLSKRTAKIKCFRISGKFLMNHAGFETIGTHFVDPAGSKCVREPPRDMPDPDTGTISPKHFFRNIT